MKCDDVRETLSAWLDGELDDRERRDVETHLRTCFPCRAEQEELRALDQSLTASLRNARSRGEAVAIRALNEIGRFPAGADPQRSSRGSGKWIGYLIASAVGFVLALLVTHWWRPAAPLAVNDDRAQIESDKSQSKDVAEDHLETVARILHATGPLAFLAPKTTSWQVLESTAATDYRCPAGGSIRTEAGSLCEVETTCGNQLRLNQRTEVAVQSSQEVKLVSGQVWCRAPTTCSLRVEAAPSGFFSKVEPGTDAAGRIGVFTCPAESSCLTSAPLNGPTQVIAASGSVNVAIDGRQRQLRQGMECRLEANESIVEAPRVDVVLAESWMQPLLTLKGHGNPELSKRVDNLLAQIGRAKLSVLYERQIRSLGEYGALPLLQFVRSEESSNDRERRRAGMRILKDIAPVWITPELIGLLEDTDTEVRVDAAQALERLHGVKFGLSAEDWKNSENTRSESIAKWKSWWSENRSGVAPPPAGIVSDAKGADVPGIVDDSRSNPQ